MDDHYAQSTWTGYVRNRTRNAFEYNKNCEVTCKFPCGKDRIDIFDTPVEITFGPINFEEIVTKPGQLVDFTLKRKIVL